MLLHLTAEEKPNFFFSGQMLVFLHLLNLGIHGLNGEVCWGFGDFFLPRVAVLSNKIAGVSGQFAILDIFLCNTGLFYFADVSKIGQNITSGRFAGFFGFFDDSFEVAPLSISEIFCEFADNISAENCVFASKIPESAILEAKIVRLENFGQYSRQKLSAGTSPSLPGPNRRAT